jgi:hypothetical protein
MDFRLPPASSFGGSHVLENVDPLVVGARGAPVPSDLLDDVVLGGKRLRTFPCCVP